MPSFQQLLKGFAERVAKRQSEMDELQKSVGRRIALEEAAQSKFANPEIAPTDFKLYHGSPYKFDEFDFESNLLKGEGAMAFGPGGYMTGHDPLAREYARNLYARHAERPPKNSDHVGIREALATDPRGTAEWLRALQVGKIIERGDAGKSFGSHLESTDALPPHLVGRPGAPGPVGERYGKPLFAMEAKSFQEGIPEYREAMRRAGIAEPVDSWSKDRRIGRGGISPLEAIRRGKEISRVLDTDFPGGVRPKQYARYKFLSPLELEMNFGVKDPSDSSAFWRAAGATRRGMSVDPALRMNLNSTGRVVDGRPGRANYKASMMPGGIIDMRNPAWPPPTPAASNMARRLYTTGIDASFADMLPYDYPISAMTPEKIGALAQLAERYSFLERLKPESTGQDFLRYLREVGEPPIKQIQALKEAGIPATFFLRGGKRGSLPDTIDPSDFNYIIHDQSRLDKPDVEEFRTGGAV